MSTPASATSVRHEIVVAAPIERAFSVFTNDFGRFKPPEHNLLEAELAETVFEPRVGGHLVDRAVDGSECRWARVLVVRPAGARRDQLGHQPAVELETDPERTSEVDVRFTAEGPDSTRVVLEHRNLDRHGDGWEAVREGVDSGEGWPLYLQRYGELFA